MTRKLRIRRKGYHRKGFIAHRGRKTYRVKPAYVPPTTYYRKDVGAVGRGRKVIPPLEEGELKKHGYGFNKPASVRRRALVKSMKEDGYLTTKGRLWALVQFFKRTKPEYSKKARRDFEWLVKRYGKSAGFPLGR